MLTKIEIKNFKRFDQITLELNKNVVLIGPNNSGKSTALQALALWEIGLRKWLSKRKGDKPDLERPGVAINRNDLVALPVPSAKLLWRYLHVRESKKENGEPGTTNVRIQMRVDGITDGQPWSCGLEFDYANEEAFHCRPLRLESNSGRMPVPKFAEETKIAFLPPMSGLASIEPKLEPGRINVLLGEGQTAQVLRNLCYYLYSDSSQGKKWDEFSRRIQELFGVKLLPPEYVVQRGEITMEYEEHGTTLDLSSAGRGLQQTILLLAYLYANSNSVLLLDEPDAHLEILRQKQIYDILTDSARQQNSQIIAASHSEVILNEAIGRDTVIAFVGKPHVIESQNNQLIKSLTQIGFEDYYKAETKGWVLYVEGPSDLAILRSWANLLGHRSAGLLEDVFVVYVTTNLPAKAREHFYGIREAKNDLVGLAIFDRLDKELQSSSLTETMWRKREIENYLCFPETFLAFAGHDLADDLFGRAEGDKRKRIMKDILEEVEDALNVLGKDPWSGDMKVSDEFLDPVFMRYFKELGLPNMMRKSNYHLLARYVPVGKIDTEVVDKLNLIVQVAEQAKPIS